MAITKVAGSDNSLIQIEIIKHRALKALSVPIMNNMVVENRR